MRWLLVIALFAGGCSAREPARPGGDAGQKPDWSKYGARGGTSSQNISAVPEEAVGITGVPYLRSIKLAWTKQEAVPTFEERNETRELPPDALQAVLRLDLKSVPDGAALRVEWYFADDLAFSDEKKDRRPGPHDFALTREERGKLAPLPPGPYRADLFDGPELLKSIRFEVAARR